MTGRARAAVWSAARIVWALLMVALPPAGGSAAAQQGAQAGAREPAAPTSTIVGRVLLARPGEEPQPLAGMWVALNRVGSDSAGVIDSVRSAGDGTYRFAYRRFGDGDAIYFTDVSYAGVGYFTDPFRGLAASGEEADLIVFDTVSAPAAGLRLRGRHFVVGERTADGWRPVVEVFELTNDTSLTIVPRGDAVPVWSVALVEGARDPEVGDGDVVATTVRFRDGRAELFAPMAPGLRQLSVRYTVPERAFPLALPVPGTPEVLEVMIAGTQGTAAGAGLHVEKPVTIEGQAYSRFLSQRVAPGAVAEIRLGSAAAERFAVPVAVGTSILVLAGALVYARRRTYPSSHN